MTNRYHNNIDNATEGSYPVRNCRVYATSMPASPYSQSAKHDSDFLERESHDAYEQRTWLNKCSTNSNGHVVIPSMALKQCIDTAAQKLGLKVPNRRGATYKSYFSSGVLSVEDAVLMLDGKPLTPADADKIVIQANSDGVRGSGKRVPRAFPVFNRWQAEFDFLITDNIITEAIFEETIKAAGVIVGLGRFRAEKGGRNGRFNVTRIDWEEFKT